MDIHLGSSEEEDGLEGGVRGLSAKRRSALSPHPRRAVVANYILFRERGSTMVRALLAVWSSRPVRAARMVLGLLLVGAAFTGEAKACSTCPPSPPPPGQVPEIDPGAMGGAITLLSGGVLLLTNRLRRK
jgi:hypothetical protein